MNLLKPCLFLLTLLIVIQLKAQSVIGLELNINKDYFKINDPGNKLSPPKAINSSFCFSYKYIFKNNVFVSTGIGLKPYNDYIYFNSLFGSNSSGNMALQLPITMGYRFPLIKDMLFFSPFAGLTLNYLLLESGGKGSGMTITPSDTLGYFSNTTYVKDYFFTATMGFMVEVMIWRGLSLALSTQFNTGFSTMSKQNIEYALNSNPVTNASQTSDGTYFTLLAFKVNYHFKSKKD